MIGFPMPRVVARSPVLSPPSNTASTYRVSRGGGDFSTLEDCFAFLSTLTQTDGVRVIIDGGEFEVNNTININYPFTVDIEGAGIGATILQVGAGLYDAVGPTSSPMFNMDTPAFFRQLSFRSAGVPNWWLQAGARYICFETGSPYVEIKDFDMDRAFVGICCQEPASIFVFDGQIKNCQRAGVGFSALDPGGALDIEIVDFESCASGIVLAQGAAVDVFVSTVRWIHSAGTDIAIEYTPATFGYSRFIVTNCDFNRIGHFIPGADFELQRDADIEIHQVVGLSTKEAHCSVVVDANATITDTVAAGTWYLAAIAAAAITDESIKMAQTVDAGARVVFLPSNEADLLVLVSGNLISSNVNRTCDIGLRRNGATFEALQGIRANNAGEPYPFAFGVILHDVQKDDYFEILLRSGTGSMTWTLEQLNLIYTTQ